jgi:predicted dinucleotide-binding enzyme
MTPILVLGAGHMGGALIEGWLAAGAFEASQLIISDPLAGETAKVAAAQGARLNPPTAALAEAPLVVLAMRPQDWRAAAAEVAPLLGPDAVVVSEGAVGGAPAVRPGSDDGRPGRRGADGRRRRRLRLRAGLSLRLHGSPGRRGRG